MQTQYNVLSYRIDLYFHDYKLAIEIAKKEHNDKDVDYEIKSQKSIKQELGCRFIRIGPDKENIDIFKTINEMFRPIKQSSKKKEINK